jgi:NAD(P)-dependent dehydrogenase (short-subunit alcohol dehydrogenase family)
MARNVRFHRIQGYWRLRIGLPSSLKNRWSWRIFPAWSPDGIENLTVTINLCYRREMAFTGRGQNIKEAGQKIFSIPGDLRDRAFCQRLVAEAVQKLGGLDIVVSNAGRQQSKASILDISDEDCDATMKTNIYAPFYIIKAALPHLSEGSCIIGTTSEQAYDPSPDLYDYAQTKAATMNYVKSLAKQLGPREIRVNGVAPGPIWTPLQISGGASVLKYTHFGNTTVFGRPGQPAELASIYVQLAAADASFTTGNIYGAGGGQGQP